MADAWLNMEPQITRIMRISKRLKQKFSVGCPVEQKLLDETHESSSVGARPSSAAPVEQKPLDPIHGSSSVGARPSSAAPVEQKPPIFAFARAYETTRY